MIKEYIELLTMPAKIVSMSVLATLARIYYQREVVTAKLFFPRVIMSTFVLWITFTVCKETFKLSDDTSLVISGALAFAFREVLDIFLFFVKDPKKFKDLIKK